MIVLLFGRGILGPNIIMTDDDRVEKNGFARSFPHSTQLLCIFNILRACWRNLCNSDSNVPSENRIGRKIHINESSEKKVIFSKN